MQTDYPRSPPRPLPLRRLKMLKICLRLFGDGMIGTKCLLLNYQRFAEEGFGFIEPLLVHQDCGEVVETLRCHGVL